MKKQDYFKLCEQYALYRDERGVVQDEHKAMECCVQCEWTHGGFVAYPCGCSVSYVIEGDGDARRAVPKYWAQLKLYDTLASVTVPLPEVEPLDKGGA